jgi:threonine/homoserine/homoserine lactone efflux protein
MAGQLAFLSGAWRPLTALMLASIVIMGSPGPSTISATAMGAAFGVRRSLKYVCGLVVGTIVVLAAVSVGEVALIVAEPRAAGALGVVSTIYVLYLAFRIATAPPLQDRRGDPETPAFAGGFLLAVANPKAYLAIAAVFSGATLFVDNHSLDAMVKTTLLCVMIVIIHLSWLLAGASLSRVLRDPRRSRLINVLLATALAATTAATFWR